MNKDMFIKEVKDMLAIEGVPALSKEAEEYFESLQKVNKVKSDTITEKGMVVLTGMYENKDKYDNQMKAKDISDVTGIPSRSIAGSLRKLKTDGYVEQVGGGAVAIYGITEKGEKACAK